MVGRDRLHNRAHAYCAHAQLMQQLDLRRRLERRPCQLGIDTLKQLDIVFFCRASDDLLQFFVVDVGHIREPRSQLLDIGADQRIRCEDGDMILQQHQTARMESRIDTAGSIGQEQYVRPHHLHQTGRQHHIRDRISLIVVDPPLHQHHGHLVDIPENKLTRMSRHRRYRKPFDFTVGKLRLHIHGLCEIAKPRSQHYRHTGRKVNLCLVALIAF